MLTKEAIRAALADPDCPEMYRWAIRWQYVRGNGFYDDLLLAAAHADSENLAKIALGFPALASAVFNWKNVEGWAQDVERWVSSHAEPNGAEVR